MNDHPSDRRLPDPGEPTPVAARAGGVDLAEGNGRPDDTAANGGSP